MNLFRALSGSQRERERLRGDAPAVVECDGLAAELSSLKRESIDCWWQGECPRKGVCHCGVKETVEALMEKRGLPLWVQRVKGRWALC